MGTTPPPAFHCADGLFRRRGRFPPISCVKSEGALGVHRGHHLPSSRSSELGGYHQNNIIAYTAERQDRTRVFRKGEQSTSMLSPEKPAPRSRVNRLKCRSVDVVNRLMVLQIRADQSRPTGVQNEENKDLNFISTWMPELGN